MCLNVMFDMNIKNIRFTLQEANGKKTLCDHLYTDDFPLKEGDMAYCVGNFVEKIHMGEYCSVFECVEMTARYEFDLLNFLIQYMPYMKVDSTHNKETVTEFYRNSCSKIMEYCFETMSGNTTDDIIKLFNSLYRSIKINKDEDTKENIEEASEEIVEFAKRCFNNPSYAKIKSFLTIWNNDVLVRPLQLLGLDLTEIHAIHIPLYEAYKIIRKNPYRLPQYSINKAKKIIQYHLRLPEEEIDTPVNHECLSSYSTVALMCGCISRMVYDNIQKRKWTSTPIRKIKDNCPSYDDLKEHILKYYYCVEEYEDVYFTKMHSLEKNVSKKIVQLVNRPADAVQEPVYFDLIPSQNQDLAIKGAISNHICMVTGGPGTGKTTMSAEMIKLIQRQNKTVIIVAPTGAAAAKLRKVCADANIIDIQIYTIHMAITKSTLLKGSDFHYVIVDEVSMVSTGLMAQFISTFYSVEYRLILIGDKDQLEAIEWGNFMDQLLKTPIKKYHLTENFRSEKNIIGICQQILDPQRIVKHEDVDWYTLGDDYRFNIGDINYLEQWISYYANNFEMDDTLTPEENIMKFEKYRDSITIVSPYRKIVDQINGIFQRYFMAYVQEYTELNGTRFYLGDRVMKLVNDYNINVMNGELGKVIKVDPNYVVIMFNNNTKTVTPYIEKGKFSIMKAFVKKNKLVYNPYLEDSKTEKPQERVNYEVESLKIQHGLKDEQNKDVIELFFSLLKQYPQAMYKIAQDSEFLLISTICLAYAITTHKSQGAEYEICIYFLNGKINNFVTINNIYTGVSRAKKELNIITESLELINSACLNKKRFVFDKLHHRINQALPHLIEENETIEESNEDSHFDYFEDQGFEDQGFEDLDFDEQGF